MLFSLDHDSLAEVVGEEDVHLLPEDTAAQYGFSGETLTFLTEVGIPSSEDWEIPFGIPEAFDPDLVWDRASRAERGWTFPEGVDKVVPIGNFPINAVVIDPETGVVYQYTDATQELIPIHQDLSSLAKTVVSFVGYIDSFERAEGEDPEHEDARRWQEVEALMADIRRIDPLPFAHAYSEWNELFDNLGTGIYT
ncbi:SUKH-4 family immunity protein [Streptomyces sp. NPDC050743]|uniref:SUKH-4 family immunity protein n=1 Tax=Streptomyces sp. NPDC050743 TaxID=3365634 RepID=UPI0037AF3202